MSDLSPYDAAKLLTELVEMLERCVSRIEYSNHCDRADCLLAQEVKVLIRKVKGE